MMYLFRIHFDRYKVCGPDGNNYWVAAQEVEAGESDTDE